MEAEVTWVLVMNSSRARIQRGPLHVQDMPPTELVLRSEGRRLKEAFPDILGQAHGRNAHRPAGVKAAVKAVDEDARDFVREVIAVLEAHRRAGEFHKLAVVAPSAVLTLLQNELPAALRGLVIFEADKDLVRLAPSEWGKSLSQDLP